MHTDRHPIWTRRELLRRLGAAGAGGLLGLGAGPAAAEPPPETTTIRVNDVPVLCFAPLFLLESFLRLEGFTDVRYPGFRGPVSEVHELSKGSIDIAAGLVTDFLIGIDEGAPIVVLGGLHAGCIETFASERVPSLRDLAGARVAITGPGDHMHVFLSSVAAHIGIDPTRDIEWVSERNFRDWPRLLKEGKVDVVAAFPPQTYAIREMGIGHVILNTTDDDPWRSYFCCMIAARREFVRDHPVAARRALRALLKTNDFCGRDPELAARLIVEHGVTPREDFALRTLREVPYGAWRTFDPEDTLRFFALRLREVGMVKGTPAGIIARGADFRILDALRNELKV